MAVPFKRQSHSRRMSRRAHWKITPPEMVACPECGEMIRPFCACTKCGKYKGRDVMKVKVKKTTEKEQ